MTTCSGADCHSQHLQTSPSLQRIRGFHAGDMHILDVAFRPRTRLSPHTHAHARFSFVLSGAIGEAFADHTLNCERDSFSFHPASLPHANEMSGDGAHALLIEVCGAQGTDLATLVRGLPSPFAVSQRRLRDTAIELSRLLRSHDDVAPILIESVALDLVSRAMRLIEQRTPKRTPSPPAWLDDFGRFIRFIQFIDGRLETHLSITVAASHLRVTPRQLASALARYRGTTFPALVRNRRLARAMELLRRTDLPLAEIALMSGFADQSHLTRCFRAAFGVTPSRFRQSHT